MKGDLVTLNIGKNNKKTVFGVNLCKIPSYHMMIPLEGGTSTPQETPSVLYNSDLAFQNIGPPKIEITYKLKIIDIRQRNLNFRTMFEMRQ